MTSRRFGPEIAERIVGIDHRSRCQAPGCPSGPQILSPYFSRSAPTAICPFMDVSISIPHPVETNEWKIVVQGASHHSSKACW